MPCKVFLSPLQIHMGIDPHMLDGSRIFNIMLYNRYTDKAQSIHKPKHKPDESQDTANKNKKQELHHDKNYRTQYRHTRYTNK